MKLNMGSADRVLRILAALIVAALYFADQISGAATLVLGAISLVFILTGTIGFCPLYFPFRFSTKKAVPPVA